MPGNCPPQKKKRLEQDPKVPEESLRVSVSSRNEAVRSAKRSISASGERLRQLVTRITKSQADVDREHLTADPHRVRVRIVDYGIDQLS
ncbi:MAG: hypothetical protein JRH20_32965 [Deltaproteobacteria bacterium]|nr:hypothetical protein [Deltaproteobacteria bacterium]